jgi:hypothetical protein
MPIRRITPSPNVIFTQLNGEIVLLDFDTEAYFSLNSVGTDMWNALTTTDSVDEAMRVLAAQYEVDYVTLRRDLDHLIQQLREANLITVVE